MGWKPTRQLTSDADLDWPPRAADSVDVLDLEARRYVVASPPAPVKLHNELRPSPQPRETTSETIERGRAISTLSRLPAPVLWSGLTLLVAIVATPVIARLAIFGTTPSIPVATSSETPSSPEATGRLVISQPRGGRVSVDGVRRGTAPLTLGDLGTGEHDVAIATKSGTVRQRVTIEAGGTVALVVTGAAGSSASRSAGRRSTPASAPAAATGGPAAPPASAGAVSVPLPFEVQIFAGGQFVGTSRDARISLPPGSHRLELVNESINYRVARTVTIYPGRTTTIEAPVPTEPVSIDVSPPSDVAIDGRSVGTTPIVDLPVAVGSHEVVLRHPTFGESRRTMLVVAGSPTRISVDLRK